MNVQTICHFPVEICTPNCAKATPRRRSFPIALSLPLLFSCAQILAVGAIWVGAIEEVQDVLRMTFRLLGFRNL